jgi:hypothetical protein
MFKVLRRIIWTLGAVAALLGAAPGSAAAQQVGVEVGALRVSLLYNGQAPSATGAACNFNATLQGFGFLGNLCDSTTVQNVPVGTYTLSLGYAFGNGAIVAPVQVTVSAGQMATHTFDVTSVVGVVTGTATVGGQAPPAGFGVCGSTNGQACLGFSGGNGAFALLLPAGNGAGFIWGDGCQCIQKGTFAFTVLAGQTRDIGNVNVDPGGDLVVKLTYNGGKPSATGAACNFNLNLIGHGFLGNLCDETTRKDIRPGQYELVLGYAFGGALLPSVPITIQSGQTTTHTFDVSALVGTVEGRVTVNGGSAPGGYGACVNNNGEACMGVGADGVFRLMIPAGAGTGYVWGNGCTCERKRSFTFTAIAGQAVSVGDQDVSLGTLRVDIRYLGGSPSATGAACNFNLDLQGFGFLGNLCDSTTKTGIPAGTYQLRLGYAFGGALLPSVPVTITGNSTTTHTFDVSDLVGIVSGGVTINGAPPASGYGVCGTTNGQACRGFSPGNGAFSLLLPAGAGSGWVWGSFCECIRIGSFTFNVTAGTTTNIGDPLKRDVTLTLGSLQHVYDGAPHAATVNAVPAGVAVTVTYNGGAAIPVNAGSYAVSAVVDSGGYVGSTTGTLVIAKAPLVVAAGDFTREFGTANPVFTVTFSGFVAGEDASVLQGTLTFATAAGPSSPVGEYSVTPSGVSSSNYSISFVPGTLRIVDTTPPVIVSVTPSTASLWPPNHQMVPVTIAVSATDATGAPACTIESVTSNEPDNGLGDGDTPNDIVITGKLTLELRAERGGKGSGRIYTITIRCVDASGNAVTATTTVSVPHSRR